MAATRQETHLIRGELLERATALLPALKERAQETEQLRRIPDDTVRDIFASGLNRIGVPKRFGGLDVDFSMLHDVAIELGRACGASAWCYSLWTVHSWWVGYYSPEAQEEVFAGGSDVLLSTAGYSLHSFAEPVSGGFRLNGHWQFSSGCDHASWVILSTASTDGPMGVLVPKSDFEILQDTWHVSGLQGTGSKDLLVKDAFVPDHRALKNEQAARNSAGAASYHDQRRYTVPRAALIVWDLVAPAIGLAQAAVDESIKRFTGTSGRARAADSPVVQIKIAESASEVDAATALLHKDIEEAQSKGERGEAITTLDLARYTRDKSYAMKLSVQAVNRLFDIAGGHALYQDDPMQRIHRDVQAASHRDGLVFDFSAQRYGRAVLGLDPDAVALRAPQP